MWHRGTQLDNVGDPYDADGDTFVVTGFETACGSDFAVLEPLNPTLGLPAVIRVKLTNEDV